jgi:hypothetical protein
MTAQMKLEVVIFGIESEGLSQVSLARIRSGE